MTTLWDELIEEARYAPSPHNVQPWRVHIVSEFAAELLYDPARLLPDEDIEGSFTLAGFAIFLEYLSIVAQAKGYQLHYSYNGSRFDRNAGQAQPLFDLSLTSSKVSPSFSPGLIKERRTSRLPYADKAPDRALLEKLAEIASAYRHIITFSEDREIVQWVLQLNCDTLFYDMDDDITRKEVASWIRFTRRHASLRKDGLAAFCLNMPGPISLRRALLSNEKLAKKIVRSYNGVLPMVFQYNPLDYYIETNPDGELIITLCRLNNISPKICYNIHDLGHVLRLPKFQKLLSELAIPQESFCRPATDLPILFHYGRSDAAVSFYGCKITPMDIQQILYTDIEYSLAVNAFSLITREDDRKNKHLVLAIELKAGKEDYVNQAEAWRSAIFRRLTEVNQDYREAAKMIPVHCLPELRLYPAGEGVFTERDIRLKQKYIIEE